MTLAVCFLGGLIFGLGLLLGGMSDPAKVLAFLDLGGAWDPSLALVMGGAIAVAMPAFAWMRRRSTSLPGLPARFPTNRVIDRRLIAGSLIFGIGWGLAGICPGPAVVLLALSFWPGVIFAAAMLVGMGLFEAMASRR